MKNLTRRSLSLLLALAMCLSLLTGITLTASAATVEYRYGSTTEYSSCSNVIYNWGSRGTVATFLSPNAESFYADNNTSYSTLSALSGASDTGSVPSSALYQELRELMSSAQTYTTSYNATRDMYAFTDCQNSALTSTKISSFYSGVEIGPGWDSGATWNREHTWPNSKGDANGSGENDIMMLRPAATSENSSRGNAAYGESSGFYDPNDESGGTYDLRGDVARIVLYVYVRWQNTSDSAAVLFGTSGVIESKEVLLSWIEADPVDTWELGRNDSVESITGTRNVFVDYPELAFLLFNESVPADYQSPSNSTGDSGSTGETVTVRFLEEDQQTLSYTIPAGQSVTMPDSTVTPAEGYSFIGWTTESVTETSTKPATVYAVGSSFSAAEQTFYALYTRTDSESGETGNLYSLYSGTLTEGDYVITYSDSLGIGALVAADADSSGRLDYENVTVTNDTVSNPASGIIWHIAPTSDGYYTLYNEANSGYAGGTGTNNKAAMLSSVTSYAKWTVSGDSTYDFVNLGNGRYLRKNSSYGYACYAESTGGALTLYKAASGTTYYTTSTSACQHTNTTTTTENATCTANGSVTVVCDDCGKTLSTEVISATGHSYEGVVTAPTATAQGYTTYTCTACGDSYVSDYVPALGEDYTVSFRVPAGISSISSMTCNSSGITLPTAEAPEGYTFQGWTTAPVEETETKPTILTGTYVATGHITLYALYSITEATGDATEYVLTDLANIQSTDIVVITVDYNGTVYAMSNDNGTSAAPAGVTVTVSGSKLESEPADNLKWNIGGSADAYIIYPNGTTAKWLYCTSANNGVRVGTNTANTFKLNDDYLYHNGTGRYIGVYRTNPDWRCYTSIHSNITGETLGFYVKTESGTTWYTTLTTVEPVAAVDGVEYTTFEEAYAAGSDGQYIQLLDNVHLDALEMTKDLFIDLNGKTMEAVVNAGEYTVYGIDTATDQYASSDGWLCLLDQDGSIVTPQIHVESNSKKYMAIDNDSGWSFHRYYVGITTIVLNTYTTGIGYKAVFCGTDEVVAQLSDTQAFGYTLRLDGGSTITRYLDTVTSGQVVSLRVNNFDVANYSETALYAKVSVTLGDTVIESAEHSITMRELVETVNENYTNYPTQLDALADFVEKHYDTMSTWQVENLYKPE